MGAEVSIPEPDELPLEQREACLPGDAATLEAVAELLRTGTVRQVACLCGAGISVSAGIPDFRTPGTGLYSNLQKYDLPTAESVFDLAFFRDNPEPFCNLTKEMFPGRHKPTRTHAFLRVLQDKDLLLRCYTQNIDTLERVAGIRADKLVEAHGSFASASCIDCHTRIALQRYRDDIDADRIPRCGTELAIPPPDQPPSSGEIETAKAAAAAAVQRKDSTNMLDVSTSEYMAILQDVSRTKQKVAELEAAGNNYAALREAWEAGPKTRICSGLVKSDVVFFGEKTALGDGAPLADADLLIIMGTSLQVMPFASSIGKVPALCPRLLINRDFVGSYDQEDPPFGFGNVGLRCRRDDNYRDVFHQSDCDAAVKTLCDLLGWEAELDKTFADMNAIPAEECWSNLVAQDESERARMRRLAATRGGVEPEPECEQ